MPRAADEEELNGPTRALKCESRGTEHRGTELSASGGDGGGRAKWEVEEPRAFLNGKGDPRMGSSPGEGWHPRLDETGLQNSWDRREDNMRDDHRAPGESQALAELTACVPW